MTSPPDPSGESFSVRLPAVRTSVTEGRHLLSAYLDRIQFRDGYDVCLAATEALSNAVRHAYRGDTGGDVEVQADLRDDALHVTVRDFGLGPTAHLASESLGLGLALMASLAQRVVFDIEPGRGTEVHLTFRRGSDAAERRSTPDSTWSAMPPEPSEARALPDGSPDVLRTVSPARF